MMLHCMDDAIVIFDGYCNFCSRSVLFIIKRDRKGHFRFAASQTREGKKVIERYRIGELAQQSLLLIEDGNVYRKSTAALRIARRLQHGWRLCYVFMIIPRGLRDLLYEGIARNRYKVFGKRDLCFIPEPAIRERFLSDS